MNFPVHKSDDCEAQLINIRFIYISYIEGIMGIVKINDELHEEIRKASSVMVRSINAQAEFWIKVGMLAETNPGMTFSDIMRSELRNAQVELESLAHE